MSPSIDDERGPYPWSQEKGSEPMNTTKISISEKGVMTIMRTYKFIDIYANVPL